MKSSRAASSKSVKKTPRRPKESVAKLLSSEAPLIAIVSLVVVVFICYANSLGNEFVFDDLLLVAENQSIRTLNSQLFLNYRALRDISYALDYALWGGRPFGFHLTNILLHAGNVLLVFALVRRLSKDLISATITALIFAVHPIQTDAVTYISGRRDLLFSFFYLLAFHTYITYFRTKWSARSAIYLALFLVLWAFSLMSKEMAVSLPLLIFVWQYCETWDDEREWRKQVLSNALKTFMRDKLFWLLMTLGGLSFTAYWVIKGASSKATLGTLDYWGGSFYLNFLTVVRVHGWYLKQLVFPTPIAQYLGAFEVSTSIFDWSFVLAFFVVGAVLASAFLLLKRDRLMAFGILSYFTMLSPVSQIIPHHELLADHYLYLPMMSFGLVVALLVRRIRAASSSAGRVVYLVVGGLIIVLGAMTILQNRTWQNERTLWTANYKAVPNSPRAALNLGNTYQESEPEKAEVLFKRALGLNPSPEVKKTLYDRLAVILIQQQKFDEAQFFVAELLSNSPDDFFGNLWTSQIHIGRKECDKAREKLDVARSVAYKARERLFAEQTLREFSQKCGNAR
ncbi:MAG TPA: hypothetical protein VJU86_04385 [Pyrinomonadaceae bacterium]|nr:hypothetical protein [Pyrinomonadaceae bacterium]